jgi:succinyl-CoA synthetase alpha subunit
MSILINRNTKLIVQGITGRDGAFHTQKMKAYGTLQDGVPIFNSVTDAKEATGANTSVIFVPAAFAADAILEASFAGIELVITITEGVPVKDMIKVMPVARQNGTKLIGPNCPGLITPGECLIGILPGNIFKKGNVGLMSRSGTLTYEVVNLLTENDMGQTTCIGIGGDPVAGLYYQELLELFEKDPDTKGIVLIGEIGGDAEEQAARFIKEKISKPVVVFIAGQTAPPGKRMGHAGAIISSGSGTAEEKIRAFTDAGVPVAKEPSQIPALLKAKMGFTIDF